MAEARTTVTRRQAITARDLKAIALLTAGVLAVPLLATLLPPVVHWQLGGFAVAALLLAGAGLAGLHIWRRARGHWRLLGVLAVVVALALVWAELAVGVVPHA